MFKTTFASEFDFAFRVRVTIGTDERDPVPDHATLGLERVQEDHELPLRLLHLRGGRHQRCAGPAACADPGPAHEDSCES